MPTNVATTRPTTNIESRRNFLKTSAAIGAAATLGLSPSRRANGEEFVKVASKSPSDYSISLDLLRSYYQQGQLSRDTARNLKTYLDSPYYKSSLTRENIERLAQQEERMRNISNVIPEEKYQNIFSLTTNFLNTPKGIMLRLSSNPAQVGKFYGSVSYIYDLNESKETTEKLSDKDLMKLISGSNSTLNITGYVLTYTSRTNGDLRHNLGLLTDRKADAEEIKEAKAIASLLRPLNLSEAGNSYGQIAKAK